MPWLSADLPAEAAPAHFSHSDPTAGTTAPRTTSTTPELSAIEVRLTEMAAASFRDRPDDLQDCTRTAEAPPQSTVTPAAPAHGLAGTNITVPLNQHVARKYDLLVCLLKPLPCNGYRRPPHPVRGQQIGQM